jgi:hypothetical protein
MARTIWDWRDDMERMRDRDKLDRFRIDLLRAISLVETYGYSETVRFDGLKLKDIERIVKKIAAEKHYKKVGYDYYEKNFRNKVVIIWIWGNGNKVEVFEHIK